MPKETWMIASALTVALLLGVLGLSSWNKRQQLVQAQAELADARGTIAKSQAEATELKDKLAESQARIESLQKEKQDVVQSHQSLENEMRASLESKDVTISQLQGKLTVNILDRVLFDSGEAELKPEGAEVLRKVADFLTQHPDLKVQVIGHTDNVPIKPSARNRYPSNWELSTARATAAVRYLSEQAGIDPRRLGAVGYGEFRPIADNSTPEGRAKNRRIAITILSGEMAGADTAPSVKGAAPLSPVSPAPALAATNAAWGVKSEEGGEPATNAAPEPPPPTPAATPASPPQD